MPDSERPIAEHILSYAQSLRGGGVERALLRLAGGWAAAGRRVTLVVGDPQGPLAAELPQGVAVVALGSGDYRALLRTLPAQVRTLRPDVIFCPGNHYTAIAAWTRLRLGRACPPIIAKVSNAFARPDQRGTGAAGYRAWLKLHPWFVDHLVAMTPAMETEAAAMTRMPRARLHCIANPPALPIAGAAPVELPDRPYLLGVGRLEPQKRWDRLLDALPHLASRPQLVILGEGSARPALETQIAALGLAGRVHLPGHAADPIPALRGAAVAVLTSDYEGVPGVLREALAVGTPVVSTDSSVAVREIVASPTLGSVVARDDAEGLVAALDHWLAPGRTRPAPVPPPGATSVGEYLALFDRVVGR